MDAIQVIHIVDDDEAIRDSLGTFLETAGFTSRGYDTAEAFLDSFDPAMAGCLILDIRMPDMDGLDLQEELLAVGATLPIIFITGHADVPTAVQALKAGAFDFLQKPFDNVQLLGLINKALEADRNNRASEQQQREIRERLQSLTPREKEVLDYIVNGKATKVIAIELELSQRTVEIYRANVMQKMQSRSIAQLVKMISELKASSGTTAA